MGLDIYVYTKAEVEANRLHEEEENAFYGVEYEIEHTEEEKEHFRKNRKYNYIHYTDMPSKKYGDGTLCNRRYLRSSYNGGGFNSAVSQMLGRDASFDWIFADVKDYGDYRVPLDEGAVENLQKARVRAQEVAQALRDVGTPIRATTVSQNMFRGPSTKTSEDAIAWYREQVEKEKDMPPMFKGGWSSGEGEYFGEDGMTVLAAMPGQDILGYPCVHLVYSLPDDATKSYIESADIVVEFIDEILELIATDGSCEIHWSG